MTDEGQRFGDALRRQLGEVTQTEFGAMVAQAEGRAEPYSQQQISFWLKGIEPNHRQAIAIEQALHVRPGTLTRLLGFVPVGARESKTLDDVISSDPYLSPEGREAVRAVYRVYSKRR